MKKNFIPLLFLNVAIIATCGLIYELLAATVSSYVLGDSITQFSLVIGIYLSAMGVGSWLSGFLEDNLAKRFIEIELAVAIAGGFSAPLLFLVFAHLSYFNLIFYPLVFLIGVLVGLEIPLLMRILKNELDFKKLVARVLALDYVGALVASVLFPIFLVPYMGLNRTSLFFGMMNAAVGLWGTWLLEHLIKPKDLTILRIKGFAVVLVLLTGFIKADSLTALAEDALYADNIIFAKSSPYQRIVITKGKAGYALYLNGNLQFHSFDEYRYHEALVHPAFAAHNGNPQRILILGGGDGLALREVLKYPVKSVILVDLDPVMTHLATHFPALKMLNENSMSDSRVQVINQDAFVWLSETEEEPFDIAIVDFPDPNNFALGKLYTTRFYKLLKSKLKPDATAIIQCTSPLISRKSFWCIVKTLQSSGFFVEPFNVTVPSFGVWGYALVKSEPFEIPTKLKAPTALRFLNEETLKTMFQFSNDTSEPEEEIEINRLNNQILVRYYEDEWQRFEHQ
ncbi:MAG: polyamine aminopropyltransferase [Pyrinomonadaceae bacterium]|nr:polyamine aminopropyltransferase [Pyrinomonadaceae bacterium]MCX7639656.1 polyamine aminopropyltransferase [Pyrinomonadaceae bacterium]MDW8303326.1 polyamine aminopropyltransferase [Acidobacteriota bacterium]